MRIVISGRRRRFPSINFCSLRRWRRSAIRGHASERWLTSGSMSEVEQLIRVDESCRRRPGLLCFSRKRRHWLNCRCLVKHASFPRNEIRRLIGRDKRHGAVWYPPYAACAGPSISRATLIACSSEEAFAADCRQNHLMLTESILAVRENQIFLPIRWSRWCSVISMSARLASMKAYYDLLKIICALRIPSEVCLAGKHWHEMPVRRYWHDMMLSFPGLLLGFSFFSENKTFLSARAGAEQTWWDILFYYGADEAAWVSLFGLTDGELLKPVNIANKAGLMTEGMARCFSQITSWK